METKEINKNIELCPKCGLHPAQAPHTCPYDVEINDDYDLCTCCEECESDCLGDI